VRILVVSSYPPRHCGIGAYARDQVARLREEGHEVTVLSPPDGDGELRAPFLGGGAFREAKRIGGGFDRVVVHFQPSLYFPPRRPVQKVRASLSLLGLVRRRPQTELVVHEADPPLLWRPDYAILRRALGAAGRISFHTQAERDALERDYRITVRGRVIPHLVRPVAGSSKERARDALGIRGGAVFVCAGFLQPSKGFDRALRAFAGAVADGGWDREPASEGRPDDGPVGPSLYIVGSVREPTPEVEAYVRDLRAGSERAAGVTFVDRYVSDEEFDRWVTAADWLVLPYRRAWSSGVLARAHELGARAMVARVGGLAEQAGEDDIVFDDDEGLRQAMKEAVAPGGLDQPPRVGPSRQAGSRAETSEPEAEPERHSDWDPEFHPPTPQGGRGMLFALILLSVLLAALAQLTLKHGMTQVTRRGAVPLELSDPIATARRVVTNIAVLGGLATFVISAAVWLVVLSKVSLSFAYPFVSLTYVLILLFDRLILHEPVSGLRWGGVALIIGGILLISRTHQAA
jgi:glycosyltransferase involved in cell wall biosynthesis/multidrug transporter EmrE-like cation transporter